MLDWLLAPIDPARAHDVGWHLSWHARFMVIAWGVMVPVGVLAARFFKVLPWQNWPAELDNRVWWKTHRGLHYISLGLMVFGVLLVLRLPSDPLSITTSVWLHHWLGWSVIIFGGMQYLSGWLRGTKGGPTDPRADGSMNGDHYDMTRRRLVFEAFHKTNGYVVLGLSWVAVISGLWQANAPKWMWVGILGWWTAYLMTFAALSLRGGTIPTYQAIWGPDPKHPGN